MQSGARAEQRLRTGAQKGDTKSGDNDALKHLVREMDKSTRARRIAYPPQCALNSYLWRVSVRQWWRWLTAGSKIRSGIWRPGHLLVHLAGWNNYQVRRQCHCHRAGAGATSAGCSKCDTTPPQRDNACSATLLCRATHSEVAFTRCVYCTRTL